MKISLVTNNMGISDKLRFRHHILSLMLGLPVVRGGVASEWVAHPHLGAAPSLTPATELPPPR